MKYQYDGLHTELHFLPRHHDIQVKGFLSNRCPMPCNKLFNMLSLNNILLQSHYRLAKERVLLPGLSWP